jgi:hypothetical protein
MRFPSHCCCPPYQDRMQLASGDAKVKGIPWRPPLASVTSRLPANAPCSKRIPKRMPVYHSGLTEFMPCCPTTDPSGLINTNLMVLSGCWAGGMGNLNVWRSNSRDNSSAVRAPWATSVDVLGPLPPHPATSTQALSADVWMVSFIDRQLSPNYVISIQLVHGLVHD